MARISDSCFCASAASSSFSRRSVMPVTAEWTISTRAPELRRSRVTFAMLLQLASDETLVPPNLRTIHAEGVRVTVFPRGSRRGGPRRSRRLVMLTWSGVRTLEDARLQLVVVVEVQQILLELFIRQHFFELAPGSFALLALIADPLVDPVQQPVVVRAVFRGTAQEFIVEIEALVVSFRHCSVDKFVGLSITNATHASAARLGTITDRGSYATLIATSPFADHYGGTTAQAQALRRTLFRPGNFQYPKGIHQRQVLSRLCISIGAQQWKRVVSCLYQRLPKAADQSAIDVADEVAEVIDRNDHARDGA